MTKTENNNLNFNISMYALVEKLLEYNSTTKALSVLKVERKLENLTKPVNREIYFKESSSRL